RFDHSMAELIENVLPLRVPDDLDRAALLERAQVDAERLRTRPQALRRLEEAEERAWLRWFRLGDVLQTQRRLADSRGAVEPVRGLGKEAAAKDRIEGWDARRLPPREVHVPDRRDGERGLDPREYLESLIRDPEWMPAVEKIAAAELRNLQGALGALFEQSIFETNHSVDHGVLGTDPACAAVGQQQNGAFQRGGVALQLVHELLELARRGRRFLRGRETIEHEQARLMTSDLPPQQIDDSLQSFALQNAKAADIVETVRNRFFMVEAHRLQVLQHAGVRLGEQRDEGPMATGGYVAEADLVGQDGLARARGALDDVHTAPQQSAAQDPVQAGDAGGYALELQLIAVTCHFDSWGAGVASSGSRTVNAAPLPGVLCTEIEPRCASINARASHRPTPNPVRACPVMTCSKRPKIRAWSSAEIPMPRSSTSRRARAPSRVRSISTGLPSPYLMALEMRLPITCSIANRSHVPIRTSGALKRMSTRLKAASLA